MSGAPSDIQSPAGDVSDASGQLPAAKKRLTANLTPEQLARKRANDREAQRAIRERTRNQIDTLNQRIRELECQQPYRHLQAVVREKEAVVAENADIKKRLESVLAIIQPILRPGGGLGAGLNELAAAAEQSPLSTDPRTFNSTLGEIAAATPNSIESPNNATDNNRPWVFPGDAPTSHVRQWSGDNVNVNAQHRGPPMTNDTSFDQRMGVDFLLENNGQATSVDPALVASPRSATVPVNMHGTAQHAPLLNPFSTLPRNTAPTCPLDALCLDFMSERRTRAAAGVSPKDLTGPAYPNFTAVVYPDRKLDAHPLSKLHTDILRTFPDISGLPEQVAIIYIMFLVMRWLVDPTQENYNRMPEWVQPRPSQLFIPHPFWIDYIPWPRMRDYLVSGRRIDFDAFFIPYTTTISLNWPHSPHDVLIPASRLQSDPSPYLTDPGNMNCKDEQWIMNPTFEAHLRDLRNWSLGPAFQSAFPEAVEGVWIMDDMTGHNAMDQ